MSNLFQEASEAGENPYEGKQSKHWRKTSLIDEGLTTPDTAFTSPWIGMNRSPDTYFVNIATHPALPGVNATKYPDSTFISPLFQAMSPTEKLDSWFASTPAGPSEASTSHPNTRDTALTSLTRDRSQISNQNTRDPLVDSTVTGSRARDLFLGSFVEGQSHLPAEQMDPCSGAPNPPNANQSKLSTSGLGTRDPFFNLVPKGPRLKHWNVQAPAFKPWNSTGEQASASPWNNTETSVSPGKCPKSRQIRSWFGIDILQQEKSRKILVRG